MKMVLFFPIIDIGIHARLLSISIDRCSATSERLFDPLSLFVLLDLDFKEQIQGLKWWVMFDSCQILNVHHRRLTAIKQFIFFCRNKHVLFYIIFLL
jgi:hypothetical protein